MFCLLLWTPLASLPFRIKAVSGGMPGQTGSSCVGHPTVSDTIPKDSLVVARRRWPTLPYQDRLSQLPGGLLRATPAILASPVLHPAPDVCQRKTAAVSSDATNIMPESLNNVHVTWWSRGVCWGLPIIARFSTTTTRRSKSRTLIDRNERHAKPDTGFKDISLSSCGRCFAPLTTPRRLGCASSRRIGGSLLTRRLG